MKKDLSEITFTIPVRIDSTDRKENLICIINYLLQGGATNIIIYENGPEINKFVYDDKRVKIIREVNNGPFHRTQYLNKMAKLATTKLIANYDCDVMFPYKQLHKAYDILLNDEADIVFPYDGLFVNIPRILLKDRTSCVHEANVEELNPNDYPNFGKNSMGGALFWKRDVFVKGGMENENFISWGAEDWERVRRFTKLGYRFGRVKGPLYHIDHSRTQDSNESNPYYQRNVTEFQKVDAMSKEQLESYIKTWPWLS